MFGNVHNEYSYHRKHIRKYSDKQSHNRFPSFRSVSDLFAITYFFLTVNSRKAIRLSGAGALVIIVTPGPKLMTVTQHSKTQDSHSTPKFPIPKTELRMNF